MDSAINKKSISSAVLVDILALTFIYFVPALSHMLKFPLYYADPMRIALFSILVLTKKENVYIMALSIPLISFLISGHPVFPKFLIVSFELFANVFLIFRFSNMIKNKFLLVFLSLILSKSAYYLLKLVLIKLAVLDMGLISTPLYIQLVAMIIFTAIVSPILIKKSQDN
jgi:hypothetical protein